MVQTYNAYSTMDSADCAAEFVKTAGSLSTWSLIYLVQTFMLSLQAFFTLFWPVESYMDWGVTKLDGFYQCAAAGGEEGFSLDDGVWEKQLNYIEQNMAQTKALMVVPYYGFYIKIINVLALKDAFASIAMA